MIKIVTSVFVQNYGPIPPMTYSHINHIILQCAAGDHFGPITTNNCGRLLQQQASCSQANNMGSRSCVQRGWKQELWKRDWAGEEKGWVDLLLMVHISYPSHGNLPDSFPSSDILHKVVQELTWRKVKYIFTYLPFAFRSPFLIIECSKWFIALATLVLVIEKKWDLTVS